MELFDILYCIMGMMLHAYITIREDRPVMRRALARLYHGLRGLVTTIHNNEVIIREGLALVYLIVVLVIRASDILLWFLDTFYQLGNYFRLHGIID